MSKNETIKKAYIGLKDTKARRRLNTAPTTEANITGEDIEKGISLEALEKLNVPVYRYGTQITIHGIIPDFEYCYVMGYKSLTKNQNGSIGVKYIAIDGEKKDLLHRVYQAVDYSCLKLSLGITSSGVELRRRVENKEDALRLYNEIPDDLIIGYKEAYKDMFGCFWLFLIFNACPVANIWKFIGWWTNGLINNESDLLLSEESKRKEELERRDRLQNMLKEREKEIKENRIKRLALLAPLPPVENFKPTPGKFLILYRNGRVVRIKFEEKNSSLLWINYWKSYSYVKFKCKGNKWNELMKDVLAVYTFEVVEASGLIKGVEYL